MGKLTKMALHGQNGLELIGRAFWSIGFLEIDYWGFIHLVGFIEKVCWLWRERKKRKKKKERKKREKTEGFFQRIGLGF